MPTTAHQNIFINAPDFFIIPNEVALDEGLQPLDGYVYGVVYWYSKLRLEKCVASNKMIADILSSKFKNKKVISPDYISHSLSRLSKRGHVKIVLDYLNHRIETIPLVSFSNQSIPTPPSELELPPSLPSATPLALQRYHIKSNNKRVIVNTVPVVNTKHIIPTIHTVGQTVEKKKVDNRNPEIQQCIDKLVILLGHPVIKETLNRYALKRLITSHGLERIIKAISFAFKVQSEDRYAPRIYNFMDLEEKWDSLLNYAKKGQRSPLAMKASDVAKLVNGGKDDVI